MTYVTQLAQLESLFDAPPDASVRKEVTFLHPTYQAWIKASPFLVLATSGPGGLDVSPRGDPAPLVTMLNENTVLLPERRGNNRIDSLRNIVSNPAVALLFFVPGVRETLRVNGTAQISIDPQVLAQFPMRNVMPKCVIEVRVQAVYFQCARALLRSSLWGSEQRVAAAQVPTAGQMLAAITTGEVGGEAYDNDLPERQAKTLY